MAKVRFQNMLTRKVFSRLLSPVFQEKHCDLKSLSAINLKRHCHAIWQLNRNLEGVFTSVEFQN